jgi:hypothetical protein
MDSTVKIEEATKLAHILNLDWLKHQQPADIEKTITGIENLVEPLPLQPTNFLKNLVHTFKSIMRGIVNGY